MSEIDPNTIISTVITKQIDATIDAIKDTFGTALDKARARLQLGYAELVKRNFARCAQIKTILYRHQAVLLKHHYVSATLRSGKQTLTEAEVINKAGSAGKIVITGTAGSGKSLFMKNSYLNFVLDSKPYVPIFIELRGVNDSPNISLKAHIFDEIRRIIPSITDDYYELSLKSGAFAFFLDGFDEIDHKQTKRIEKDILSISSNHPKCAIIVSSRQDDRFFAWQDFTVCKVLPMSKSQIVTLIKKIDYEPIVKTKFIERIEGGLYEVHEEFLSNPLLATIMLLTFEQIADIPEKMHVFYQQAFETLFHRHDATKEMYKRDRYTSFPVDEFKRLFGAFCLVTYIAEKFSFDDPSAVNFIEQAFELEGAPEAGSANDFLNDLLMSVCMLQRDGTDITFSHRSFQEYFCASYICSCDPATVGKLLDEIVSRAFFDRTLSLIRDISPELFDRHWTLPRLGQITGKISNIDSGSEPKKYIALFCDQLIYHKRPEVVHFRGRAKMGRNRTLIHYIYGLLPWQRRGDQFAEDAQQRKVSIIKKHLGDPLESPRTTYLIEDLKEEMIRELLEADDMLDDRQKLVQLYETLRVRYEKKDERMSNLIARSKRP